MRTLTRLVQSLVVARRESPIGLIGLVLLACVCSLFVIGVVMVFNTTSAEILDMATGRDLHHASMRQLVFAFVGVCLGAAIFWFGYERLLANSPYIFGGICVLLALVLVPGLARTINGARRWIGIGGYTLQPSEFAKIFAPLVVIHYLGKLGGAQIAFKTFLKGMAALSLPVILVFLEPDTGTTLILGTTFMCVLFVVGVPWRYWALPMLIAIGLAGVAASQMTYIRERVKVYLDPESDLQGRGHQPHQAKIAAGSGGLWGRGPGESLQKLSYLPEAQNDYIAAIFAEEYGFAGVLVLISLYMTFAYAGFRIALQAREPQGMYVACALTFLMSLQAFLNLGVVSSLLPSKGITLPFFSQGGTSLIANFLAVGLLLSVHRSSLQRRGEA